MNASIIRRSLPWFVTIGVFVIWEIVVVAFKVDPFILPAPTLVFNSLLKYRAVIVDHALQTLMTTLVGFAIGVGLGMLLGLLIGTSRIIYDSLYPTIVGFNAVPKVAIVPVLVIWFGIGTVPAIITAFLSAFFPVMVNVATGLTTIAPELRDVMRSLGATKTQILLRIGIPQSMPYFFASLKLAIVFAFVGSIVSESLAANLGIGYLMVAASGRFDVPLVFAGLLVVATMGVILYEAFVHLERRVTFWATRAEMADA